MSNYPIELNSFDLASSHLLEGGNFLDGSGWGGTGTTFGSSHTSFSSSTSRTRWLPVPREDKFSGDRKYLSKIALHRYLRYSHVQFLVPYTSRIL